jgi:hypothetical protein
MASHPRYLKAMLSTSKWRPNERIKEHDRGLLLQSSTCRLVSGSCPDPSASRQPAGRITLPRGVIGARRSIARIRTAWTGSPC